VKTTWSSDFNLKYRITQPKNTHQGSLLSYCGSNVGGRRPKRGVSVSGSSSAPRESDKATETRKRPHGARTCSPHPSYMEAVQLSELELHLTITTIGEEMGAMGNSEKKAFCRQYEELTRIVTRVVDGLEGARTIR
jgi:hypothetical protein